MRNTEFLRSDQLDGSAAIGYLQPSGLQTNVLHLPVRGTGDGGIYSTLADMHLLWSAFADGRIVALSTIAEMVRLRPTPTDQDDDYGLGFWLHARSDASWPATTLVCRSGRCTSPAPNWWPPSSPTPPTAPGRSLACSTG